MNLLATFHGIGSLNCALFAAWDSSWRRHRRQVFLYSTRLAGLLALIFLAPSGLPAATPQPHRFDWITLRRNGFSSTMICFYLAIGFYVATELGIAAWIVEYLIRSKGMPPTTAAYYLSGFFAFVMVGRLPAVCLWNGSAICRARV